MSASSASAIPYIGSKISLVTNSELRYEGILININTANSTVTLRDVRMSGTENRKAPHFVMPSAEVFDYIIFNGKDIKDLTVSEPGFSVKEDPAVVAVNVAPPHTGYIGDHRAGMNGQQDPLLPMHNKMGQSHMANIDYYAYAGHPARNMGGGHYSPMNRGMRDVGNYGRNDGYGRTDGYQRHDYGRHDGSGYMGSGNRGGFRGSRGGTGGGPGKVVGELTAQPNTNLKTQVASAFDFEQSNSKFEKDKVEKENVQNKPASDTYNKSQSFFDNISCETLNRQHGRDNKIDREKQRVLDTETFGPTAALSRAPRYYRRGPRRMGGGMRGRGGPPGGMYGGGMYRQQQGGHFGGPGGGAAGFSGPGGASGFSGPVGANGIYNMAPHVHAQ